MPGHKYSPDKAKYLLNPMRSLFLPARRVLQDIRPVAEEVWADIGCGSGFFTVPLARMVEKVYALDISSRMLTVLRQILVKNQIKNVELLQNEERRVPLEDHSVDGVLLALVAHELDAPQVFFHEIARILKPQGRLAIAEFAGNAFILGPPPSHRLAREQVDSWAVEAGLEKGRSWKWSRAVVGWEYVKR